MPVLCAVKRSAPSAGAPWGHSLYHAGRAHSGWFLQRLVKPSDVQDQASGQVHFYKFAIFDPRQSHVCEVKFGTGRCILMKEGDLIDSEKEGIAIAFNVLFLLHPRQRCPGSVAV